MDKIKKIFELLIPETVCNLRCGYCYVIQREQNTMKVPELDYSPEIIGKALTQKRLGGVCYFSICGAGETFVPDYLIEIVYELLKNGHYVNITTNGTLTKKMKRLETIPEEWRNRLQIAFSFHYLELVRLNLIDTFFNNVEFVKSLGCSYLVQLNLYDDYVPVLDEIKKICLDRIGALPQIVATRKETSLTSKIELMTEYTIDEYKSFAKPFESPLFDFTMKNFNVKRKEFCYAGSWAYTLNLKTGILKRCYASCIHQNIFENIEKPIMNMAVGKCCGSLFCLNSSHFMSLGVIPSVETPTYVDLRNRKEGKWYTPQMEEFLSSKLIESNTEYNVPRKLMSNVISAGDKVAYHCYRKLITLKRKKK